MLIYCDHKKKQKSRLVIRQWMVSVTKCNKEEMD